MANQRVARAQACCSTTSTDEFAVVGRTHYAIVASDLGYQEGLTSYDSYSHPHNLGTSAFRDLVWRLGAGFRLPWQPLQIYGAFPMRLQYRRLDVASGDVALAHGDTSLGARLTVLTDNTHGIVAGKPRSYVPFLDIFLSAKAPTGRSPSAMRDASAADVGGNGQWEWGLGTKISKHVTSGHVVQVLAQHVLRRARNLSTSGPQDPVEFSLGDLTQLQLSWIHLLDMFWSFGGALSLDLVGPARQRLSGEDFAAVPQSKSRRFRAGAFMTHSILFPELDFSVSASIDPPVDRLARNLPVAGLSLGVKLGYNVVSPLF